MDFKKILALDYWVAVFSESMAGLNTNNTAGLDQIRWTILGDVQRLGQRRNDPIETLVHRKRCRRRKGTLTVIEAAVKLPYTRIQKIHQNNWHNSNGTKWRE
jgi:hypothetical protein